MSGRKVVYGVVLLLLFIIFFFFKQKTAYEMCGRDWSSDVCSSDLPSLNMGGRNSIALCQGIVA